MRNSTIVAIITVLLLVLCGWYWWSMNGGPAMPGITPRAQDGVACTMDAMQCPDGSYVGRTGPNCAFAPCPSAPQGAAGVKGSLNQGNVGQPDSGQVQPPGGSAADDPGVGDASMPPANR